MIVELALLALSVSPPTLQAPLRVGSKKFTESVVLGEVVAGLARSAGTETEHVRELGGTRILWNALLAGEIDVYPEYTGTIRFELFAGTDLRTAAELRAALAERGGWMSRPLGFQNTYAIGMTRDRAVELGVERISQLAEHPALKFGLTAEFLDRGDGWPGLKATYALPQSQADGTVRGLDHDLAYRGLAAGDIDVVDLYSTDAEIRYYDLAVLADDRAYFPEYAAVLLARSELETSHPAAFESLRRLEGALDAEAMVGLNARAKLDRVPEARVAAEFLQERFGLEVEVQTESALQRLWNRGVEHLTLVATSLFAAVLLALPLGIFAARRPRLGAWILAGTGILLIIPSLAMFVFMIPVLGIGSAPAVAALFLYSLLPIVRNTYTGLRDIPTELIESAEALGLPAQARLLRVELPLAAGSILAGIRTSAVFNVGTATLGALIGAGGYGQPILTGIRLDDTGLILQGAVPAAGLAILFQLAFDAVERRWFSVARD